MKRARLVAVLTMLALLGGVGLLVRGASREGNQRRRDQTLLNAIKRKDASIVCEALNAGADANARDLPPNDDTLLFRSLVH